MPYTGSADTGIYYEVDGSDAGDPLVLIHGAGAQMVAWHPDFIAGLVDSGFRVVRFDNRDVGLSPRYEGDRAQYMVDDMVNDIVELLDHLHIDAAHIAGQSMGGVLAQRFALDRPQRTLSLCIIYSTHRLEYMLNDPEIAQHLASPPAATREARIAHYIAGERLSGLEGLSEEYVRSVAEKVVDRAWDPDGAMRQMEAIYRSEGHADRMSEIRVPTAILHGRNDRIISFEAALELGRAIPGAEVHILPGMGHQIRPSNWPDFLRSLRRNVALAKAIADHQDIQSAS